ncbi:uncharacterized protein LOC116294005 [Actinia tenebrosa]|uniref:Uncharacterized protein LOC116294005 n=1 Tax=Actinia tenebrosa TaxID=6105 RepID=A0A6P8HQK5_ACTTE|nr:uncharacterized protein LOC116294005 [Actinia tenebrosa]
MEAPILKSKLRNQFFRRARRNIIVERLRQQIQEGEPFHRLAAAKVRELVLESGFLVSLQEFGHAIRLAFPSIKRRRVHSCWYYYGIQEAGKTNGSIAQKEVAIPSMSQKCHESRKRSHPFAKRKEVTSKIVENGLVKTAPFKIASLNICCEDLAFNKDIIGTGTFGRCYSGEYKGLPVAIKVFKGKQSFLSIHKEAEIMTKIPSHPNIAMLIGVRTDGYPFMLVSKLCTMNNHPQTYAAYLKEHEINKTLTTNLPMSSDSV